MHSESIPSRSGVGIFFEISHFFVMKAPMWMVCDAEVFPSYTGDLYGRSLFLV